MKVVLNLRKPTEKPGHEQPIIFLRDDMLLFTGWYDLNHGEIDHSDNEEYLEHTITKWERVIGWRPQEDEIELKK